MLLLTALPRCLNPTACQWWTWTSIFFMYNNDSPVGRIPKLNLRIRLCINLEWSCSGINGPFHVLCNCGKHTLQYESVSSPPTDFVYTITLVQGTGDSTLVSFPAATSSIFAQCADQEEALLDDPTLSTVCQGNLPDDYLTGTGCSYTGQTAPLGVLKPALLSAMSCVCQPLH